MACRCRRPGACWSAPCARRWNTATRRTAIMACNALCGSAKCNARHGCRASPSASFDSRGCGLGSVNLQHGKVLLAVADLQVHFAVLYLAEQALAHGRVGGDQHDRLVIQLDLEAGGIGGEE